MCTQANDRDTLAFIVEEEKGEAILKQYLKCNTNDANGVVVVGREEGIACRAPRSAPRVRRKMRPGIGSGFNSSFGMSLLRKHASKEKAQHRRSLPTVSPSTQKLACMRTAQHAN